MLLKGYIFYNFPNFYNCGGMILVLGGGGGGLIMLDPYWMGIHYIGIHINIPNICIYISGG